MNKLKIYGSNIDPWILQCSNQVSYGATFIYYLKKGIKVKNKIILNKLLLKLKKKIKRNSYMIIMSTWMKLLCVFKSGIFGIQL